jgi:hypothetical protein
MEERTLCPLGLMLYIVAVPVQLLEVPQVDLFERQLIKTDNFLHKQYWPIQIRPPPAVAIAKATY